jgi:hypothetical protein
VVAAAHVLSPHAPDPYGWCRECLPPWGQLDRYPCLPVHGATPVRAVCPVDPGPPAFGARRRAKLRQGVAVVVAHSRRNAALAARIAELGLTERELADRINDAERDATGVAGKATDRYVRLLLDGTVRWPWLSRRQALEQVLGRAILELGSSPGPDADTPRATTVRTFRSGPPPHPKRRRWWTWSVWPTAGH